MKWVSDFNILKDDINASQIDINTYRERLQYVQNCIDCSMHDRDHDLLNELWRNHSADTKETYLKLNNNNKKNQNRDPTLGEEGDDEERENRENEMNDMTKIIENLRAKYGEMHTKTFYGDEERVENIKEMYKCELTKNNENVKDGIIYTETNKAAEHYGLLKNYEKNTSKIIAQKKSKKNNNNNTSIQGIISEYIYHDYSFYFFPS